MKPTILLLTCAVLACATLTTFAAEVELSGPTPTAPAAELRDGTLVLTLSGNLPLRPGGGFLFGDSGMSLFDATMQLKKAMNEPSEM